MSHLRSEVNSYLVDVARLQFPGQSRLNILGSYTVGNSDLFTQVFEPGGNFDYQTADVAMEAVSDSANDTSGGSQAEELLVTGVSGGLLVSETVVLAGLTPVALANDYIFINDVLISKGNQDWATANTGNIDIRVVAGANIQQRIPAGISARGQTCIFRVPDDETWAIMEWAVYLQANKQKTPVIDSLLQFRTPTSMWVTIDAISFRASSNLGMPRSFVSPIVALPGNTVALVARSDEASTTIFGTMGIIRIRD